MFEEKVYVSFPNEGEYGISENIIKKWIITEPKEIGDTIFFWSGGIYLSMKKEDFKKVFK
jgi:hypothetical protein